MKNISDYFDAVFWINSKNRPDRYRNMIQRLPEQGIEPLSTRFDALYGGNVDPSEINLGEDSKRKRIVNMAEIGCFLSHRYIYEKILNNRWEKTLILEDDVLFEPDFQSVFNNELNDLPEDWDLLYFGQRNYDLINNEDGKVETRALRDPINKRLYKADRCWLTHAYAVRLKSIDRLLEGTKIIYSCLDGVLADLQKDLKVYAIHPAVIKQDGTISSLR